MHKIIKYVLLDILRSRTIMGYTAFLLLTSWGMFMLDSSPSKSMLSLVNILLMVVPLVSIIFSTVHFYNSYEFMELMLAAGKAKHCFSGKFFGSVCCLMLSFFYRSRHSGFDF
jgi:Cu-processing system permease protein